MQAIKQTLIDMWEDESESMDGDIDPEQERKRIEGLPIYQKAEEIRDFTQRIIDSIDDENVRMIHSNCMLEASIMMVEKIASAEAVDDYILKMENATLVKLHAKSLLAKSASLIIEGSLPKEYLVLLRKEIEAFRVMFVDWIHAFDSSKRIDDGWALF